MLSNNSNFVKKHKNRPILTGKSGFFVNILDSLAY